MEQVIEFLKSETGQQLLIAIGAFVMGVTRWGIKWVVDYLCKHYPTYAFAIKKSKGIAVTTIEATYHSVVKDAQKALVDGKIDDTEEKRLKENAFNAAKTALIKSLGKPIADLLERKTGDLNKYAHKLLNDTINEAKN